MISKQQSVNLKGVKIMGSKNEMKLEFWGISDNEAFARVVVAAFSAQLDPTLEEISDIKMAISEAVTNSIVHGYQNNGGVININCKIINNIIEIEVIDYGIGIQDIELARRPLYTTGEEQERSGMGFTVMETFMDKVDVFSKVGEGTKVIMSKSIAKS